MAFPTRGGFSGVLMLPDSIQLQNGKITFRIRDCINHGYTAPATGEYVASALPIDHENLTQIRSFKENEKWDHPEIRWIQFHLKLIQQAISMEEQMNPAIKIFWQAEESGANRIHIHVLFVDGITSRGIGWVFKRMRREIVKNASETLHAYCPDFPQAQIWGALNNLSSALFSMNRGYSPRMGKAIPQPVNPHSFMSVYLYNPRKNIILRGATQSAKDMGLSLTKISDSFGLPPLEENPEVQCQTMRPGDTLPLSYVSTETDWNSCNTETILKTGIMEKLCMEALRLCKEKNVFNLRDFKLQFPDKFMQFSARNNGINKLTETINLFVDTAVSHSTAWEIAKKINGDVDTDDIDNNLVVRLCTWQGYSPKYVSHTTLCWLSGEMGKKNTLYLYGPPNTGKTMFAESICRMVQVYGNVNHNNMNFPFNDCHGKAIIWWEECTMHETYVEAAKCIMGGSGVRVDKKGQDSILVEKTPVIITSNNDITQVTSRNAISGNHQAAIRARCLKFNFNNWLTSNWGLITPKDMYQFLCWGELFGPITLEGYLHLNPTFRDHIPYNQPKSNPCDTCFTQYNTEENLTVCPVCSAWTRKPFNDNSPGQYDGTEDSVYKNITEGNV
uniref:Nonstructural protein 1 n=1 Tax=Phoenicopteridae parvo-like hybrid virus TaxID=2794528 RepID=A0A8A4XBZ3_9VIRU|nr:MAG: nonstructural protein 1 [Phoenicopteridae parvo-like hybrid virus]